MGHIRSVKSLKEPGPFYVVALLPLRGWYKGDRAIAMHKYRAQILFSPAVGGKRRK